MKNLSSVRAGFILAAVAACAALATPGYAQTKTNAGTWVLTCKDKKKPSSCEASYAVADKKKNTVLSWSLRYNDKKVLVSTVNVPHGVLLTKGVNVKWPNGTALKVDYRVCRRETGCSANVPVPKDIQKIAKAGKGAVLFTVYSVAGKDFTLGVPIKGLDKALSKMK